MYTSEPFLTVLHKVWGFWRDLVTSFGELLGIFWGFFRDLLGNLFSVGVQWASMEFNAVSKTLVFTIEKTQCGSNGI